MHPPPGTPGRRGRGRVGGLLALAVAAVVVGGCVRITTGPSGTPGGSRSPVPGATATASPSAPVRRSPSAAPSAVAPSAGRASISPDRIGYIAFDERLPYVREVSAGIQAEAERLGLDLVACDARNLAERALACATQLADAGVAGVISFQPYAGRAAEVCAAYGDLPTIAIAIPQEPCQIAIASPDDHTAGELAGGVLGRFAKERWDCDISAYVSLERGDAGPAAEARMAGYRQGFETFCPLSDGAARVLQGADRVATAQVQMRRLLASLAGGRIVVVGLSEDAVQGALAAAREAGRGSDVWVSGIGADPSVRREIACNEQYVASAALFPDAVGSLVVPALADAIAGRPVEPLIRTPLTLVTKDNVREVFPDTPPCDP